MSFVPIWVFHQADNILLATSIFLRLSTIAIAEIYNLFSGDGVADIVERRFGVR